MMRYVAVFVCFWRPESHLFGRLEELSWWYLLLDVMTLVPST